MYMYICVYIYIIVYHLIQSHIGLHYRVLSHIFQTSLWNSRNGMERTRLWGTEYIMERNRTLFHGTHYFWNSTEWHWTVHAWSLCIQVIHLCLYVHICTPPTWNWKCVWLCQLCRLRDNVQQIQQVRCPAQNNVVFLGSHLQPARSAPEGQMNCKIDGARRVICFPAPRMPGTESYLKCRTGVPSNNDEQIGFEMVQCGLNWTLHEASKSLSCIGD